MPGFVLRPEYFGLLLFQKLGAQCPQRLKVNCSEYKTVHTLGGKTEDGRIRLLVSCFDTEDYALVCSAGNFTSCQLYSIRSDYSQADAADGKLLKADENGCFCFNHTGGSGVYLLEFTEV